VTQLPVVAFLTPSPGQQGSLGTLLFLGQIALIFVIFWFLLIRPQKQQQKKHEAMLKALKKGDEVVTAGGVVGEVVHIKDDRVTIKSAESRLVIQRERITAVLVQKAEAGGVAAS
jgi:preprotein translocase subunit YajC